MIRRSFRIGLALGLLGGLAFALAKVLGARPHPDSDASPVPTEPWPPLREDPAPVGAPRAAPDPAPVLETMAERVAEPEVTADDPPRARREPLRAATPTDATPAAPAKQAAKRPTPRKPAKAAAPKKAPAKRAAAKSAPAVAWVEPSGDVCPTGHPVKAKLASKIFHLPGMLNYERTRPDRCYRDAEAAESDGLRPAKR